MNPGGPKPPGFFVLRDFPMCIYDVNVHAPVFEPGEIKLTSRPPVATFWDEPREESPRLSRSGPRVFDDRIGCWVEARPRRDISRDGVRAPRPGPAPLPDNSGRFWWLSCPFTGYRIRRIEALDLAQALVEAERLFPGERVCVERAAG